MQPTARNPEHGMALVFAIFSLVAVVLLLATLSARVVAHANVTNSDVNVKRAYNGLEAGLARSLAELDAGEDGFIGVTPMRTPARASDTSNAGSQTTPLARNVKNAGYGRDSQNTDGSYENMPPLLSSDTNTSGTNRKVQTPLVGPQDPAFGDRAVQPEQVGSVEYFAFVRHWESDGLDNNANGVADDESEAGIVQVTAVARSGNAARRVDLLRKKDFRASIWNNALFGGTGNADQQNSIVEGDFEAFGSVYVLGDALNEGDHALDLQTGFIHNNYEGLPRDMLRRIPGLNTVTVDGDRVESLGAGLHVRNGLVGLSRFAEAGQPDSRSNKVKETLDGIFVSDGFTGDLNAEGEPSNAFGDEMSSEGMQDAGAEFPTYDNDNGDDHLDRYLEDFEDPRSGRGQYQYHEGDMNVDVGENYFWDANQSAQNEPVIGKTLGRDGMPAPSEISERMQDSGDFFVWYNARDKQMVVNGRVAVNGNISFNNRGSDNTIYYDGKGSLMAMTADAPDPKGGNTVTIKTDLISRNLNGSSENTFPNDNLLGIMSSSNIVVDNEGLTLMGAFYAQDLTQIKSNDVQIYGGAASNRFKMNGTPKIAHVPEMNGAWTPQMRMIGSSGKSTSRTVAWSEQGVN